MAGVLGGLVALASVLPAGHADTALLARTKAGQAILLQALEAAGGRRTITGLRALQLRLEGDSFNPVQGRSPSAVDRPERDGAFRARSAVDLRGPRVYQEQRQSLPGGFDFHFATIVTPDRQYNVVYRDSTVAAQPIATGGQGAPLLDALARYLPPLLLRRAVQALSSVQQAGTGLIDGAVSDVVEYSWDERTRHRLEIDRETHAIRRLTALTTDPLVGLTEASYTYGGTQRVGGVTFPETVRLTRRGLLALDLQVRDLVLDEAVDTSLFRPAPWLKKVPFLAAPATSEPAQSVYQIAGLGGGAYRTFFLPTDGGVVLFDALLGPPAVELVLAEVRKTLPGRPVKAIVVSHFHADHAGGVGALLGTGATIYVPAGSEAVIARYAAVTAGLDAAAVRERLMTVEPGRPVMLDAARGLVLRNLGATAHVDGMLVLHDSLSATVIHADMYSRLSLFNETFAAFADWLRTQVPGAWRLLGSHHEPMSVADLQALRRAWTGPGRD